MNGLTLIENWPHHGESPLGLSRLRTFEGKGRQVPGEPNAGRVRDGESQLTGYWWENSDDWYYRFDHLVMENGRDFHLMTLEEYYYE